MRPAIAYGEPLPLASATSRLLGRYSLPALALVIAFGAWSDAAATLYIRLSDTSRAAVV